MKKWLNACLILICSIGILLLTLKLLYLPKKVGLLEEIVPDQAITYFYGYNLSEKISNFCKSEFYQNIVSTFSLDEKQKAWIRQIEDSAVSPNELFGSDVALAVFSPQIAMPKNNDFPGEINIGDFILLTRLQLTPKSNFQKIAGEFFNIFPGEKEDSIQYQKLRINQYNLNTEMFDQEFSYVVLGDVLVISDNQEIIKQSVDLFSGKDDESLSNNPDFQKVDVKCGENKKNALIWYYINSKLQLEKMLSGIDNDHDSDNDQQSQISRKFINYFNNFMEPIENGGGFLDYDLLKDGLVYKRFSFFGADKVDQGILRLISFQEVDKNLLNAIPKDIIGFYGINGNVNNFWELGKEMMGTFGEIPEGKNVILEIIEEIEIELGVEIEKDIVPALGNNFGGIFSGLKEISFEALRVDNSAAASMPSLIPDVSVYLQIKDKEKTKNIINTELDKIVLKINMMSAAVSKMESEQVWQAKKVMGLPEKNNLENAALTGNFKEENSEFKNVNDIAMVNQEIYKNFSLKYINITGLEVKPNYFILGDYLVLSLFLDSAKKIVDIYQANVDGYGPSLYSGFSKIIDEKIAQSSNIAFFSLNKLLKDLQNTEIFGMFKLLVPVISKGSFNPEGIDSIFETLSKINYYVQTSEACEAGVIENTGYIKIEGLN